MKNPLVLVVAPEQKAKHLLGLLSIDFDGVVASSAQEALDLYRKNYLKIRIVIVDVVLPDMSGLFLLKEFRRFSGLAEVIMISEKTDTLTVVEAMRNGAFDFLLYQTSQDLLHERLMAVIGSCDPSSHVETVSRYPFLKLLEKNYKFNAVESILSNPLALEKKLTADDFLDIIPGPDHHFMDFSFLDEVYAAFEKKANQAPVSKILIVEDDLSYAQMVSEFLRKQYHVVIAPSAADALMECDNHPEIQVVLMDMVLSDLSGVALIPQVKQKISTIEIIAMSGFSNWEVAMDAMKVGAGDFLQKPILKDHLLSSVTQAFFRYNRKHILPVVKKALLETKVSYKDKLGYLKELSIVRKGAGEAVFMQDLYVLFPELKHTCIPDGVCVPGHLQDSLDVFVENLRARLESFQGAVPL